MDLDGRVTVWWSSLTASQRRDVLRATDALPDWLVERLAAAGIPLVEADLSDGSRVFLMPTRLREFVDQHRADEQ